MLKKTSSVTLLALILTVQLYAQSVEEIVSKHLDALGGKQLLSTISSVKMENQMEVMGNSSTNNVVIVNGKAYKSESEIMGSKIVQVFNEKGGWMINPMGGSADPVDLPEEAAKQAVNQLYIIPLLDYANRGIKLSLEGKEKVGSSDAYKLKVTYKEGASINMFIDASTYYLTKTEQSAEAMGQLITNIITFSDFKKTESGWVVPYSTDIDMGGMFQLKNKLSKIEVNPTINPSEFEKK